MFQSAKVVQAERRTKRIHSFFIPKRSLPSPEATVVQAERRTKRNLSFFIPKRSLPSPIAKIGFSCQMTKQQAPMQSVALIFWDCITLFIIILSANVLFL